MATDIIARGMITEYIAGTNINFTENRDGTVEISASGSISSEDSVARDAIGNHKSDTSNPHNVTPAQIGLGNVDNTSDLDKPISTAVQKAIDNKADKTVATTSADGLMSASDKGKLDAFEITTTGGKLHDKDIATTDLIPTSLPANGGNADTLDGLHAEKFMRYEPDESIVTSINDMITPGTYGVYTVTPDFPTGYGTWGLLEVQAYGSICYQIIKFETNIIISRAKIVNQTEWSEWKRSCDGGNADTLDGLHANEIATNPNLLINPDFKINQRGNTDFSVSYHTGSPIPQSQVYTVDRWRIMEGRANISNGKYVLNGTIIQVLENSVGGDFTATVSVESGTATASYDDSTKTFTIVGNNAVLNWAKLEYGSVATPFIPPDPATELMKCMRYYEKIVCSNDMYTVACQYCNNLNDCAFTIPMMPKRVASPTSTIDYSAMSYQNSENVVNVSSASAVNYTVNSVSIIATLSSPTTVCTHGWVVGFTIKIDAEIY